MMVAAFLLGGCDHSNQKLPTKQETKGELAFLKELKNKFPRTFSFDILQAMVEKNQLQEASIYVNSALKSSVHNFALHVVNGFLYEEMARISVDDKQRELAGIAYRSALSLEPSHWLPAYLMGNFELKHKNYQAAQEHLANALLLNQDNPDIAYALASASYYLSDIPVALFNIEKAVAARPDCPFMQRGAAMIYAAAGQFDQAEQSLARYKNFKKNAVDGDFTTLSQRVEDWQRIHQQARLQKVGILDMSSYDREYSQQPAPNTESNDAPTIVLNCYIVDILDADVTQKGNNILQSSGGYGAQILSVTLGNFISRYSQTTTTPRFPNKGVSRTDYSKNLQYGASAAQMSYAAKIANVGKTIIQYTARPSISMLLREEGVFAESDRVTGTPPGGSSITVDAGVKISCKPLEVTPDGEIVMDIKITGSSFGGSPSLSSGLTNQLISLVKSQISTTVKARPGQSIFIAGLRSDMRTNNDVSFPFLRFLPFAQYFFSSVDTKSSGRNILYIITPRLGGKNPLLSKQRKLTEPSKVANSLSRIGKNILGTYRSQYYILRYLETSPMFATFRSGDLIAPFWGYGDSSLKLQLRKLLSFLYF